MRFLCTLLVVVLAASGGATAQDGADHIRLNQIGFYPTAPKMAVIVDAPPGPFFVTTATGADTVFIKTMGRARLWDASGETVRQADFSGLTAPGEYVLIVPGVGTSHPFTISEAVHRPIVTAALKGYYFQRASMELEPPYAGAWARPAGHPDDDVRVHASAATAERPTGTTIAAPRGWYDAGDYNKYIVNSGISTYTLLALHEHYPAFAAELATNIPEGGDAVPDVLDEALWNLRWMLDMQDPNDGGVYHKLTHANFSGEVMPHEATAPRYVVQKGTAATLDFAAVMAQAARIYDDYADAFPGLADSMRTAALDAWQWARRHPNVPYNQGAMNQAYDPDVATGAYGDARFGDEFAWAAAELYVTTEADSFLTVAAPWDHDPDVPAWPDVSTLGWFTALHYLDRLPADVDTVALKDRFLAFADRLAEAREDVPYGTVMGHTDDDFVWGSNSVAGNQAMVLMQAFRLTADSTYLHAALDNLDYLLGRNATGYSFLTGYGDRTPMHPHHRPSEADDLRAPVPGLLVGGPQPGGQDIGPSSWQCDDYRDAPANSWIDDWCSYATNEITINWNAPLVYVAGAIEAALAGTGTPSSREPEGLGAAEPFHLKPLYPNPAQTETTVAFELGRPSPVVMEVVDILGRRVDVLLEQVLPAGPHRITWDMDDLPQGLYLLRMAVGEITKTRAVLKAK